MRSAHRRKAFFFFFFLAHSLVFCCGERVAREGGPGPALEATCPVTWARTGRVWHTARVHAPLLPAPPLPCSLSPIERRPGPSALSTSPPFFVLVKDLRPRRLHRVRPVLQVLHHQLCGRGRPADGRLLDGEHRREKKDGVGPRKPAPPPHPPLSPHLFFSRQKT